MSLNIEQRFRSGRFHATRWNQNPFEDSRGEWPPSQYRFLRAIAARWFEYARETGDRNEALRDALLRALVVAGEPQFHLPPNAAHSAQWPSRGVKQYHPRGLEKTDKGKKDGVKEPWMLRAGKTLTVDGFAMIPPNQSVYWYWPSLELDADQLELLDQLLRRMTYFGRAESLCSMRRRESDVALPAVNCVLTPGVTDGQLVLVTDSTQPFDVSVLLLHNDDHRLRGRRIPPGTRWVSATLPPRPVRVPSRPPAYRPPRPQVCTMQFAVGGRVFPPDNAWITLAEKFRGAALSHLREIITGRYKATSNSLTRQEQAATRLLDGKEYDGSPIRDDHAHASFFLVPDQAGQPTRMFVHRREPFTEQEERAVIAACEKPLPWKHGNPDWLLRLVPLSAETPLPSDKNIFGSATRWRSLTPYVPTCHVFDRRGNPREGVSVEEQCSLDLRRAGINARIVSIEVMGSRWTRVHMPSRNRSADSASNNDKRGYDLVIEFEDRVTGPIALGHSCHYGVGLFGPAAEQ